MNIPIASPVANDSSIPVGQVSIGRDEKVMFSFAAVEKDEYFNLDGTCQNWASDLFDTMKAASEIKVSEIYAGKYSGKNSRLRIHSHKDVKNPCSQPKNSKIRLEDMWQIRISSSKGGIHGVFYENVFFVVWFDPQHNLYPDPNHGGLKKVIPPSTCCKDRDSEITRLIEENKYLTNEIKAYEELLNEQKELNGTDKVLSES